MRTATTCFAVLLTTCAALALLAGPALRVSG